MSVTVGLDRLREEVSRFGRAAYVITVMTDGRPHAVSVSVSWDGDELVAGAGRKTRANAEERAAVTMLWPPFEPGGYSLIVDGVARAAPDAADDCLAVRPTRAVLHRSKPGPDPRRSCGSDCVPVLDGSPNLLQKPS